MGVPTDYFKPESFLVLGSASVMIVIASNTYQYLLNSQPKYFGFICSLVIAYLGVILKADGTWVDYILAFFNACLLFSCASGIQIVRQNSPIKGRRSKKFGGTVDSETIRKGRRFWDSWYE